MVTITFFCEGTDVTLMVCATPAIHKTVKYKIAVSFILFFMPIYLLQSLQYAVFLSFNTGERSLKS
jgi:hypothetical protein